LASDIAVVAAHVDTCSRSRMSCELSHFSPSERLGMWPCTRRSRRESNALGLEVSRGCELRFHRFGETRSLLWCEIGETEYNESTAGLLARHTGAHQINFQKIMNAGGPRQNVGKTHTLRGSERALPLRCAWAAMSFGAPLASVDRRLHFCGQSVFEQVLRTANIVGGN
jgi:hypothetical protein